MVRPEPSVLKYVSIWMLGEDERQRVDVSASNCHAHTQLRWDRVRGPARESARPRITRQDSALANSAPSIACSVAPRHRAAPREWLRGQSRTCGGSLDDL